jgi:hypothetical protein
VEIWYFDKHAIDMDRMEIHIEKDKHHPGEIELWID